MISQLIGSESAADWRASPARPSEVPIQPLFLQVFQPRQKGKAQQMAESKIDLTLPVGVHILLLHIHLRVVAQHPFDHGGYL